MRLESLSDDSFRRTPHSIDHIENVDPFFACSRSTSFLQVHPSRPSLRQSDKALNAANDAAQTPSVSSGSSRQNRPTFYFDSDRRRERETTDRKQNNIKEAAKAFKFYISIDRDRQQQQKKKKKKGFCLSVLNPNAIPSWKVCLYCRAEKKRQTLVYKTSELSEMMRRIRFQFFAVAGENRRTV